MGELISQPGWVRENTTFNIAAKLRNRLHWSIVTNCATTTAGRLVQRTGLAGHRSAPALEPEPPILGTGLCPRRRGSPIPRDGHAAADGC